MSQQLHVVFGAGQVGAGLAALLLAQGHRVRVVRRSQRDVASGIEVVAGDATDPAFAIEATRGAQVLYHCMNPSAYTASAWAQEYPRQGEALIAAAVAHDARLVVLDNLYGYGVVEGARTESTRMGAEGPKGLVRVAWAARLEQAAAEQGLRYVAGRAGDFFGPGAGEQALLSMPALAALGRGWPVLLIGDPSAQHAFSFVPDVVAGLAALGSADEVDGRTFHLPVVQVPPRRLVEEVAAALGVRSRVLGMPGWLLGLLAPVVPLLGELRETLYQWDRPFEVDDSAFRMRFPALGTDSARAAAVIAAALAA